MDAAARKSMEPPKCFLMLDQRKPGPHHVFSFELLKNFIFFIIYFFFSFCLLFEIFFLPFPRTCYLAVMQP